MYAKYKNKRVELAGRSFASKQERDLYLILLAQEKAGEIQNLKCQTRVSLTKAKIVYIPDFQYEVNGEKHYAEQKGFETDVWAIKKKLYRFYGDAPLHIYKKLGGRIILVETIIPEGNGLNE